MTMARKLRYAAVKERNQPKEKKHQQNKNKRLKQKK